MRTQEEVERFIEHFAGAKEAFLHGCCYWFAKILVQEFYPAYVSVKYEPVEGHFLAMIDNRYYDVRGDVTELYDGKFMYDEWELFRKDKKYWQKLMRDCRDFLPPEDE
jgi:hypothetical protein